MNGPMGSDSGHSEQPTPEMKQIGAEYREDPMDMELAAIQREIDANQQAMNQLEQQLGVEAAALSHPMLQLGQRREKLEAAKRAKQEAGQHPETATV